MCFVENQGAKFVGATGSHKIVRSPDEIRYRDRACDSCSLRKEIRVTGRSLQVLQPDKCGTGE